MNTRRRKFLKQIGGATTAVAAGTAFVPDSVVAAVADRNYSAGRFGLELDGVFVGYLHSTEGGDATGVVVANQLSGTSSGLVKKHIANLKYEEITITFENGMNLALYDWIKNTLEGKAARKNGAIIAADYNYQEQSRLTFSNALISEIGFPALDAASKDVARMTVKFAPSSTQRIVARGGTLKAVGAKQKTWLSSNFKLEIPGVDASRVSRIEVLVVRQKLAQSAVGVARDDARQAAGLELPNLVVTLAESHAASFRQWHEDFVVKGMSDDAKEKSGSLSFLSADLNETLSTLTFGHLGIFRIATGKADANSEAIPRLQAEMYCEEMKFNPTGGKAESTPTGQTGGAAKNQTPAPTPKPNPK